MTGHEAEVYDAAGTPLALPDPLPDYLTTSSEFLREEVESALRNNEMPLEALRFPITPVGLHFLLVHYDIPVIDHDAWRLTIGGALDRPVSLDLHALASLPRVRHSVTLECAGNGRGLLHPRAIGQPWMYGGVGTAVWEGPELAPLLETAGVFAGAIDVLFTGADRGRDGGQDVAFERSLSIEDCRTTGAFLALRMNGEPLPVQHGGPLRLVVPGWYGMASVKWLESIRVLETPFAGFHQAEAYRYFLPGEPDAAPVNRIQPRALLIPPGIPDGETGERSCAAGPIELRGRAWSGFAPIERVAISVDGGRSWQDADLEAPEERYQWQAWRFAWTAVPGAHELCARAFDASDRRQSLRPVWNLDGYANNGVQRVRLVVTG